MLTAETHAEYKNLDALGTEIARATGLGGRKRENSDADSRH
jgi:hypothetical protein